MRPTTTLLTFVLFPPILFAADPDPFLGSWKLNWAKSRSSQQEPKIVVRTYRKAADGVRVSETWVEQNGQRTDLNYIANYDGEDYPVLTSKGSTVEFTRQDTYTVEGMSNTNGKVDYTFKRMVSKDSKTLTIEISKTGTGSGPTKIFGYDKLK